MENLVLYIREALALYYESSEASALTRIVCLEMLGMTSTDYYIRKGKTLSADEEQKVQSIIRRLQSYEPIQYIQGFAPFMGHSFAVNRDVLIPRPETAELVECIISREQNKKVRILDVGTGSGCIAISLALSLSCATVTAWDISQDALYVARQNAKNLDAEVSFDCVDCLKPLDEIQGEWDIIVSNPPYITPDGRQAMERNVLDWEPSLALFVPQDQPLLFYERIADIARKALSPDGRLYFEINQAYGKDVCKMLTERHFKNVELHKDLSQNDRYISCLL